MTYELTSQRKIRQTFWRDCPDVARGKLKNGDYSVDTRMAFVDYVDYLAREGKISPRLAERATLQRHPHARGKR